MLAGLIITFVFGVVVGSFVNVVIYRVPRRLSIVTGRSRCIKCGRVVAAYDLIPVLSAIFLRLRCRACSSYFSWRYPFNELILGIFWALLWWFLGADYGFHTWLFAALISGVLLALFWIDFDFLELPNGLTFSIIVVTIAYFLTIKIGSLGDPYSLNLRSMVWGALVTASPLFLIWYVTAGKGLGFGDVKLGLVLGLMAGASGGLLIVYVACLLGGLAGLVLLLLGKATRHTKLPLGSFMSLSALAYLLFGPATVEYIYLLLR